MMNTNSIQIPGGPGLMPKIDGPKAVAQEFESLFVSMMLRSMRKTVNRSDLLPESMGEKMYRSMLDDEYARMISKEASLGLSDLILKEIQKSENPESAAHELNRLHADESMFSQAQFNPNIPAGGNIEERVARWQNFIDEAAARYDIDAKLISAVVAQESAGEPYAVSRAGARGLMQLMPATARDLNVRNVFNPRENILGGTRYLRRMLDRFGDIKLALASYNAGPHAVQKYNGIPPYAETQDYVVKVLARRDRAEVAELKTGDSNGKRD